MTSQTQEDSQLLIANKFKEIEIKRQLMQGDFFSYAEEVANRLNDLSVLQADINDNDAAINTCQQAIVIYEKLTKHSFNDFALILSKSLLNLASYHLDEGNIDAAVFFKQSIELQKKLVANDFTSHAATLANSFNAISAFYSSTQQFEDAIEHAKQSVNIYKKLVDESNTTKADYANSLNNLALRQTEADKKIEAIKAAKQAIDIYTILSESDFDKYAPYLAGSLNNLANHQSALAMRLDSIESSQKSIEIYQKLADKNFEVFGSYLAVGFYTISLGYMKIGKLNESLTYATQAKTLIDKFAKDNNIFTNWQQATAQLLKEIAKKEKQIKELKDKSKT